MRALFLSLIAQLCFTRLVHTGQVIHHRRAHTSITTGIAAHISSTDNVTDPIDYRIENFLFREDLRGNPIQYAYALIALDDELKQCIRHFTIDEQKMDDLIRNRLELNLVDVILYLEPKNRNAVEQVLMSFDTTNNHEVNQTVINSTAETPVICDQMPLLTLLYNSAYHAKSRLPSISDATVMHLSNILIFEIPAGIFQKTHKLKAIFLDNCHVREIHGNSLQNLHFLQSLDISGNTIERIPAALLTNNKLLTYANFSHGLIQDIPEKLFQSQLFLLSVDFSHNRIAQLPALFWPQSKYVKTLDFSNNLLKTLDPWEEEFKRGFRRLEKLDLGNNLLEAFNHNLISNKKGIRTMYLSSTLIKHIGETMLHQSSKLDTLFLDNCRIEDINKNSLEKLSLLEVLDISSSHLKRIPTELFMNNTQLKFLNISHSPLTSIDRNQFTNNRLLESVDISSSHLKRIPSELFMNNTQLKFLNISHSPLTSIKRNQFTNNRLLESVDLSDCHLFAIPGELFANNVALQTVNLRNSHITMLDSRIFHMNPHLIKIDLGSNELTRIPDVCFENSQLRHLIFNNNQLTFLNLAMIKDCDQLEEVNLVGNPMVESIIWLGVDEDIEDQKTVIDTNSGARQGILNIHIGLVSKNTSSLPMYAVVEGKHDLKSNCVIPEQANA